MDLRHLPDQPSPAERDAVDAVLGPAREDGQPIGLREAQSLRTLLLPALHALQGRAGFISRGGLGYVSRRLSVPPAETFAVASFYALFAMEERPAAFAHVCDDVACLAAGAEGLCAGVEARLGPAAHGHRKTGEGAHGAGRKPAWSRSPCLGLCEQAPAAMVTRAGPQPFDVTLGGATPEAISAALEGRFSPQRASPIGSLGPRRLLRRIGVADPMSLESYRASGGYQGLQRAFALGPEGIFRELNAANLVGRGGAAFPTGRKWAAVAQAPGQPKYVVCNADESEPGTFKDRVLMEGDPFALVEAMTICALATGASKGFIYLRGEYPVANAAISNALVQARAAGMLGNDIQDRGLSFDIELRRGAGAYICGEETALFASVEGLRGEPRTKPPFPVNVGLFGKPTCVNNVETLVAALDIVEHGAQAYTAAGTAGSPGTKLFCVSGKVRRPGVYEVPFGTTLGALLELAGGCERPLRAVLLGGAAGTFVGPDQLSLPLSFEDTRKAGATLGSGVVLALDDTVPLWPVLQRIAAFFRDESCGQCVPCRVGTVRQEELLARVRNGAPPEKELALFRELSMAMRDASICGLGQTATSAVASLLPQLVRLGGAA
jgi:NADH-quinone oxidoreductase subunit F